MTRFVVLAAGAALLAACGGALPAGGNSAATLAVRVPASAAHPDRGGTWMSAAAATTKSLLYISDAGTFDVFVYAYPSLQKMGKLTGFNRPQGECTDLGGDIWITNTTGQSIVEFTHGGSSPIADLSDPTGYPVGCAVDPTTGNLAVTNIQDLSGGGDVLVYKDAQGTPKVYSNPAQPLCYFAAYDAKGNLFVSGSTKRNAYRLTELAKGGNSLSLLTVGGGTIHYPGTVAFDGTTLVLGDQQCLGNKSSCLYQASVSGKSVQISGSTPLGGSCDVAQAWIGSSRVAGGDNQYCNSRRESSADLWPYPSGGSPTKRVTGLETPVGAAVSLQ